MLGQAKKAQKMLQMARNPAESERIRALMGAFATVEKNQREALRDLAEAADVEPEGIGLGEPRDTEERISELCDAVGARFNGDVWGTWVEHVAPDDLDGEAAAEFAGIGAAEWEAEKEAIVEEWRENPDIATDDYSDAELVEADVSSQFGVDVATFEEFVVEFEPADVFTTLLAGEFEAHTEAVEQLTEEVDG